MLTATIRKARRYNGGRPAITRASLLKSAGQSIGSSSVFGYIAARDVAAG